VRVTEGKGGDFWSFFPLAHIKLVWVEVERKEKIGTVGRFKAEVVRLLLCPISGSIMLNARTRASDGTQLREARPTLPPPPPPPSSTYLTPPLHPCLPLCLNPAYTMAVSETKEVYNNWRTFYLNDPKYTNLPSLLIKIEFCSQTVLCDYTIWSCRKIREFFIYFWADGRLPEKHNPSLATKI